MRKRVVAGTGPAVAIVVMAALASSLLSGCARLRPGAGPEYESPGDEWDATHFSLAPTAERFHGPAPFTTTFSAEVRNAGGPVTWRWDFGDGSPASTEAAPTHTFQTPGLYAVRVDVRNRAGEPLAGTVLVRSETPAEAAKNRE